MATQATASSEPLLAISTTSSAREAERISRILVENHIVACANVILSVRSIYRWQGEVCQDVEALIIMKTTRDRIEALKQQLNRLHSYEVPELIFLPIADGLPAYLQWMFEVTHPEAES